MRPSGPLSPLFRANSPPEHCQVAHPEPFFLSAERGRRYCVLYAPAGGAPIAGAIVWVHPFAEEMNKSRRMAALQARALADAGWFVLQLDLFGCGDSEGEFGQADWARWLSDVKNASEWLRKRSGRRPALWGLRAGCLLACEVAGIMDETPDLLLWQPTFSGRQSLQQFLRLKVASQMFGGAASDRIGTKQLLDALRLGESVEVAGYTLSAGVGLGLDASELAPPVLPARVAWLEVVAESPPRLSPAAQDRIGAWKSAGHHVEAVAVAGPAFWQTQEIAEAPELIEATLARLARWQI